MKELVETYSIQDFLLFLITFALGVKGLISFYDWGYERLKKMFNKETGKEQKISSIQNEMDKYKKSCEVLEKEQEQLKNNLKDLNGKLDLLIASDKDEIKSFITREHHYFCYQKKWIDDYSMDCIEKRFEHYRAEKGNSFIEELMNELRELPKKSPEE
jgi:hypothetical protein